MKFHLVVVSTTGYSRRESFDAESVTEACKRHVAAWLVRHTPYSMVMRDENGHRYSMHDSRALVAASA